jgi:hypothetical protein
MIVEPTQITPGSINKSVSYKCQLVFIAFDSRQLNFLKKISA